jgi:urease accessory protein
MYDAASLSDAPVLQRAVGELRVSLRVRDGVTALEGLRQAGCLKARFPRPQVAGWLDVVTLNTSGGIAGGDALASSFQVQAGARATIASQAAERFYRASHSSLPASVRTRIEVDAGGAAEWLPQETILFDRCALNRRLQVELADDAWFLGVESLVFGRAAMGETVAHASLRDLIEVRRGGRMVLHDAVRLEGEVAATLRRPAIADGARAVATLVHVGPGAEGALEAVREELAPHCTPVPLGGRGREAVASRVRAQRVDAPSPAAPGATTLDRVEGRLSPASGRGVQGGVSAWDGMLVVRLLAADSASLRAAVVSALQVLRSARPLPRVWQC